MDEADLITDISLGAFFGVIHAITLWLTTDYGTMVESLMLWGNEYMWMYISVGLVDAIIIIGTTSAVWWATQLEDHYLGREED